MHTVVITGLSRGIGRALAQRFLKNGDFVIGTSTSGNVDYTHDNLIVLQLDLSQPVSIAACAERIAKLDKKIDILINNAGIWSGVDDNPTIRVDVLRKTLEVNLFGTIEFTELIIPLMNKDGHIVNVSSRMGSFGLVDKVGVNWPDYKISKVGLNMATQIWARRMEGTITVSSVHPGWVKTDMGGSDAEMEPEEAADDIFKLATSRPETGQFWFKGKKFPW